METHRGEGCVKMKAEIWVMQPQAKDTWSTNKLEETRKYPILEPSEGAQSCHESLIVDFLPELGENKVLFF